MDGVGLLAPWSAWLLAAVGGSGTAGHDGPPQAHCGGGGGGQRFARAVDDRPLAFLNHDVLFGQSFDPAIGPVFLHYAINHVVIRLNAHRHVMSVGLGDDGMGRLIAFGVA